MKCEVIIKCQVTQLTFGNIIVFDMEPEEFPFDGILTKNENYTVFRNGLNHYVFPTNALRF